MISSSLLIHSVAHALPVIKNTTIQMTNILILFIIFTDIYINLDEL
ncbi:hypothetical protein ECN1_0343 [Escherichia coli N1]|nr:hypothetical protein ECN1_0343 [Escherichia coli N1]